MKKTLTGATVIALSATGAFAAGLDRSGQSVTAIFAPDNSAALSFGYVMPSVTGEDNVGGADYDVGRDYSTTSLSYTNSVGGAFNYSLIFDQPYGADVDYDANPGASALGGTMADLNSHALTFVGRYKVSDRFSVFAGIGVQRIDAEVALNGGAYAAAISPSLAVQSVAQGAGLDPRVLGGALRGDQAALGALQQVYGAGTQAALQQLGGQVQAAQPAVAAAFLANGGYQFELEQSTRPNYLIGAAYEIPDIAFRVAATYRFETEHKADTTESFAGGAAIKSDVEFVTPRSFNLDFQTGIAAGTLLTASYRWTEFSAVDIIPTALGSDLVNLEDGRRFTVGVARVFNEKVAGSVTLSYEPEGSSKKVSPLGPTDGLFGISIGGRYTDGPLNISGGINYSWVGDAKPAVGNVAVASFEDNHVIGIGFRAEMKF